MKLKLPVARICVWFDGMYLIYNLFGLMELELLVAQTCVWFDEMRFIYW